jgi:mannose/fructose/N-acetylgalactosamine-specific phosphotransferase system component IID
MIGLGFLFSIFPGLAKIRKDRDALISRSLSHLEFFNSHPYMASYALGSTLEIEEEILAGRAGDESVRKWKKLLPAPLGSVGDTFFWKSWRPLCGVLGVFLTLVAGWLGPVIYVIIYNALHVYVRIRGLFSGYAKGRRALEDLKGSFYRRFPDVCDRLICILAGGIVIVLALGNSLTFLSDSLGWMFVMLAAAFWLLLHFFGPRMLLYATSAAMLLGIVLWETLLGYQ